MMTTRDKELQAAQERVTKAICCGREMAGYQVFGGNSADELTAAIDALIEIKLCQAIKQAKGEK